MVEYSRQGAVVLQLIFHLSQLLDDTLALLGLFVICDSPNSPVKVIDRARLESRLANGLVYRKSVPDTICTYENDWPSVAGRDRGEARRV